MFYQDTTFCEWIVYEWYFQLLRTPSNHHRCRIRLDFEIRFKSLLHAPAWDIVSDGVVQEITNAMLHRAISLTDSKVEDGDVHQRDAQFKVEADGSTIGTPNLQDPDGESSTLWKEVAQRIQRMPDPSGMLRAPLIGLGAVGQSIGTKWTGLKVEVFSICLNRIHHLCHDLFDKRTNQVQDIVFG
mmetsp:Transcript_21368/g.29933  ORF Transcript_21368/g.29933 Transcript_21368/m.29933 type:complete len:185 (-) Transcript_21368:1540-2094(-)